MSPGDRRRIAKSTPVVVVLVVVVVGVVVVMVMVMVVVVVGENFGWTWMTARWTNWEMDDLGAGWETTDLEDE